MTAAEIKQAVAILVENMGIEKRPDIVGYRRREIANGHERGKGEASAPGGQ